MFFFISSLLSSAFSISPLNSALQALPVFSGFMSKVGIIFKFSSISKNPNKCRLDKF